MPGDSAKKSFLNYTIEGHPQTVSFAKLNQINSITTKKGLILGIGIGCGVVLGFVSWCSLPKRKTPVFILNQLCLWLMVLRCILYMVYLTGPFNSISWMLDPLADSFDSAFNVTIAVSVVYVMLIASIESLFVFQVYVMFKGIKNYVIKWLTVAASCAFALAVVLMYIIETTYNLKDTWQKLQGHSMPVRWNINLPFILFCASINCLSILLVGKLLMAIRTRQVLGLKQFNALHVLLIMTLQTCIIPSAMIIYNYSLTERSPIYVNLSVIVIVCSMPFSSLWASSANNSSLPNSCLNSVFSRVASRESNETLTFSFRSKADAKEDYSPDFEKSFGGKSTSERDDATIDRILQQIEMELRIQTSR